MKSKLTLLAAFTGLFCMAQNWEQLNIPESPSRYDDVFFLNENLGWAADGAGSAVYKTTDGGNTWVQSSYNNGEYLRNIEFLNEDIGFLGALSDHFYRTTDGGETWETVWDLQGAIPAICGLDTVGESTVYGCGAYFEPAYIIKSTDSGETWDIIDMSAYANSLVEILFIDEETGYVSGGSNSGGVVLKTTDGGQTWTEIYNSGRPGEQVWKLQILFSNPDVMFGAVQSFDPFDGKLIKSEDGGQSWISRDVPDPFIQGVGFITENHGWMGGHYSGFLETTDGGQTWNNLGFGWSLNRFQIFSQNLVFCSGHSIYKYTDNLSVSDITTERPKDMEITVAPNPIKDVLNISVDYPRSDHMVITLFDESGKLIKQLLRETIDSKGKKSYSFDFPQKPGVYHLLFHYDLGYQSKKIIKK
ncbi:MAG: YCF48-related protein [Moheibacter sp.]